MDLIMGQIEGTNKKNIKNEAGKLTNSDGSIILLRRLLFLFLRN